MRVISGMAKSLVLKAPKGVDTRPTTDRTKETLFNMINPYLHEATFLDLFAGTGSIGIEALSRYAKKAFFVEKNIQAIQCIEENLRHTKLIDRAQIFKYDYMKALHHFKAHDIKFDVIFIDPPYLKGLQEAAILKIIEDQLLNVEGIIVCESDIHLSFDFMKHFKCFKIEKEKRFKTNKFTFIKRYDRETKS